MDFRVPTDPCPKPNYYGIINNYLVSNSLNPTPSSEQSFKWSFRKKKLQDIPYIVELPPEDGSPEQEWIIMVCVKPRLKYVLSPLQKLWLYPTPFFSFCRIGFHQNIFECEFYDSQSKKMKIKQTKRKALSFLIVMVKLLV
ncbi:hypothetical protein Patl1_03227 [Pistacia atlantica]|uniref:Uncharacterized protein n=1 Tax=Pistacia atlantica TaxID=434234 RepID=A0ACC1C897_9ROSI|nr:hypothetical protein Patl1_03227 [Pistacia atlantica]